MQSQLRERAMTLREQPFWYLSQFTPFLEMETAQINTIKKSLRHLKRNKILNLAELLMFSNLELIKLRINDQSFNVINFEKLIEVAI